MPIDSRLRPARAIADYPIGAFTFYPPPVDDAEHQPQAPRIGSTYDMTNKERRQPNTESDAELRAGLTREQLAALATLEHFRWHLRFVRRPMFRDPIPVVFHADGRHAVLEPDGSINDNPGFFIRN
jgi:hypothetical protein